MHQHWRLMEIKNHQDVDFSIENYARMADFRRRCKGRAMVRISDQSAARRG